MNSHTHPLPSLRSGFPPLYFVKRGEISDIHLYTLPLLSADWRREGGRGDEYMLNRNIFEIYINDSGHSFNDKW
jgi:hypothetical protein